MKQTHTHSYFVYKFDSFINVCVRSGLTSRVPVTVLRPR